jgi:hypothetical protein
MFAIVQKIRTLRFFKRAKDLDTFWQIILWWEKRRIPFNAIVGTTGFLACAFLFGIAAFSEKKFDEAIGFPDPPLFGVIAIFLYGIAANVCFTGGWLAELFVKSIWKDRAEHFGEIAFVLGLLFSVALTLVPVIVCSVVVAWKLLNTP